MQTKIRWVYIISILSLFLVWLRLLDLQLFQNSHYSRLALNQYQVSEVITPKRGQILASDGFPLAKTIASASGQSYRFYPESSQSAYLTGFVGKNSDGDDIGYFGLEGFYDRQLRGRSGLIREETDVFNRPILLSDADILPSQQGSDLQTSIDRSLQYFAAKSLQEGLQKYQSTGGTVSIMESKTGRILAMVSIPTYDPNSYSDFPTASYKSPMISDGYEPGSTFKPLVMAAALDAKAINLNTICTVCNGPYLVGDAYIRSWDNHYYPNSSLFDIILHSDNVGMSFISQKLGKDRLISYLKNLNLGEKTGVDLQEESSPLLKPSDTWYPIDLATASFGQGIAVTRLQMLAAINTLANRGVYLYPHVVDIIRSPLGDQPATVHPSHRVYSETAVESVIAMMVNGVENGEVRYYRPLGYKIAGKTGTAQVPIAGHYDPNVVISSFVGFAPADDPKFTMLVTLNNPQSSPWGSQTAAPLWFKIANQIFKYYRIPAGS